MYHCTNNPSSIGGAVSKGCIRMYNRDVLELSKLVSIGTPVIIENY
ncbi:L,D-transpeptidase [Sporomusa carbonis]